jgi:hypothetical protein
MTEDGSGMSMSPQSFGELVAVCHSERRELGRAGEPFDVAVLGISGAGQPQPSAAFGEAGATWWLESLSPLRGSLDDLEAIVRSGPPR